MLHYAYINCHFYLKRNRLIRVTFFGHWVATWWPARKEIEVPKNFEYIRNWGMKENILHHVETIFSFFKWYSVHWAYHSTEKDSPLFILLEKAVEIYVWYVTQLTLGNIAVLFTFLAVSVFLNLFKYKNARIKQVLFGSGYILIFLGTKIYFFL